MERYALIVAGGKGKRFGGELPKQFQDLLGTPLLIHTLRAFEEASEWDRCVLVLHTSSFREWEEILATHSTSLVPDLVPGGEERFQSVQKGVDELDPGENSIVAVHDAVRPLIRPERIRNLMEEAETYGNAVPCVPLQESLRKVERDGSNEAVDRSNFRAVQTPQCFRGDLLKKAMEKPYHEAYTDEATVVEALGEQIHLSEGDPENIKITSPQDLRSAELLLKDRRT